jgi:tape measure domain-containing protein
MNLFDLFASLSLDANKFYQGLQQAQQAATRFSNNLVSAFSKTFVSTGNALTNIGKGISGIGDGITAAGQKASVVTAGLGSLLVSTFNKAKSFIATYESSMVVFRQKLQGGEEAAKDMYNALVGIAKGSAYAQEHMVEAGKVLVAMGNDANKTKKYVQAATDAVAAFGGTGQDVEELAHRFARMSQQTNLYTMDLNILAEKGVRVWDILATHYHKTTTEIKDMARKGLLPAKEGLEILTNAMEETNEQSEMFQYSVAGMAKALKDGTLTGTLDSLNTSFRSLSLSLLDLDPREKTGIENIKRLNKALSAFGKVMEKIGSKFSKIGKDLGVLFDKISESLGVFSEKLDAMPQEKADMIATIIERIAIAGPALIAAGKGVKIFGNSVQGLGAVYTAFGKSLDFSGAVSGFKKLKEKCVECVPAVKSLGGAFSNLFGAIKSMLPNVVGLLKNLWGGIIKIGGKVVKVLSDMFGVFKIFIGYAKEMFGYMVEPFKKLFSSIVKFLAPVGEYIKTFFSKIAQFARNAIIVFEIMFNKISKFLQPLTSAFQKVFGAIGGVLSKFGSTILGSLAGIGGAVFKAFSITGVVALVVAGLGLLQQNFTDKIAEISNFLMTQAPSMIRNFANGINESLPTLMVAGVTLLNTIIDVIVVNLPLLIDSGIKIVVSLVTGLVQALPKIISKIGDLLTTIVNVITENLPAIIEAGMQILAALIVGLANALPQLIPAALDMIITIVVELLDNIDLLIDAGIQLIFGLADGLIKALPRLIEKAPILIEKLVVALTSNLPKITAMAIKLIVTLAVGIVQAIPQLIAKVPQIIGALVEGLKAGVSSIAAVGSDLIMGLWNGISNMVGWIKSKIQGFGESVLGALKSFFGIESPSKLMRNEVGKYIAQGIGVGFSNEMDNVEKSMISDMNGLTSKLGVEDISYNQSVSGKANAGLVNGLLSALNVDSENVINVYIGGKKIASEIYDPLMNLMRNREVRVNA